jgi:hypothetical protein
MSAMELHETALVERDPCDNAVFYERYRRASLDSDLGSPSRDHDSVSNATTPTKSQAIPKEPLPSFEVLSMFDNAKLFQASKRFTRP